VTESGVLTVTDSSFKIGNGLEYSLNEQSGEVKIPGAELSGSGRLWYNVDQIDIDFITTSTDDPFSTDYSGFYVKAYAAFGADEKVNSEVVTADGVPENTFENNILLTSEPYDPSIEGFGFGSQYRLTVYPRAIMDALGVGESSNKGLSDLGIVFGDWKPGEHTYAVQFLNVSVYGDEGILQEYAEKAAGTYTPPDPGLKDGDTDPANSKEHGLPIDGYDPDAPNDGTGDYPPETEYKTTTGYTDYVPQTTAEPDVYPDDVYPDEGDGENGEPDDVYPDEVYPDEGDGENGEPDETGETTAPDNRGDNTAETTAPDNTDTTANTDTTNTEQTASGNATDNDGADKTLSDDEANKSPDTGVESVAGTFAGIAAIAAACAWLVSKHSRKHNRKQN
jgi:hypothetical protein